MLHAGLDLSRRRLDVCLVDAARQLVVGVAQRIGSRDITALVTERIVREIPTGFAQARRTAMTSGRPSMVAASPASAS
jgi:hypothetical protein